MFPHYRKEGALARVAASTAAATLSTYPATHTTTTRAKADISSGCCIRPALRPWSLRPESTRSGHRAGLLTVRSPPVRHCPGCAPPELIRVCRFFSRLVSPQPHRPSYFPPPALQVRNAVGRGLRPRAALRHSIRAAMRPAPTSAPPVAPSRSQASLAALRAFLPSRPGDLWGEWSAGELPRQAIRPRSPRRAGPRRNAGRRRPLCASSRARRLPRPRAPGRRYRLAAHRRAL